MATPTTPAWWRGSSWSIRRKTNWCAATTAFFAGRTACRLWADRGRVRPAGARLGAARRRQRLLDGLAGGPVEPIFRTDVLVDGRHDRDLGHFQPNAVRAGAAGHSPAHAKFGRPGSGLRAHGTDASHPSGSLARHFRRRGRREPPRRAPARSPKRRRSRRRSSNVATRRRLWQPSTSRWPRTRGASSRSRS